MDDLHSLAQAVYYEATGEPREGQYGVARVVINRAEKRRSLCSVVYAPGQFKWTGRAQKAPFGRAWIIAKEEAMKALEGPDNVGGARYFHSGPKPKYLFNFKFTIRIGGHSFYR